MDADLGKHGAKCKSSKECADGYVCDTQYQSEAFPGEEFPNKCRAGTGSLGCGEECRNSLDCASGLKCLVRLSPRMLSSSSHT